MPTKRYSTEQIVSKLRDSIGRETRSLTGMPRGSFDSALASEEERWTHEVEASPSSPCVRS